MEKTYTWKRIPQPDPVYLIDGKPVTAAEFLAEHERRAVETVGFPKSIIGEPWKWTEWESTNPAPPSASSSESPS